MKTLVSVVVLSLAIAGCSDVQPTSGDTTSSVSFDKGSTPARPAFTYRTQTLHRNQYYESVAVCDTDATRKAIVYRSPYTGAATLGYPCWSPNGASIAVMEQGSGVRIKVVDVSVSSGGAAQGSNARTIYSTTDGIQNVAWCSSPTTARIAFTTRRYVNTNTLISSLYTIAQTGGAATLVRQDTSLEYHGLTWSPDDSRIALIMNRPATYIPRLCVVNASTGAMIEDDTLGVQYAWDCEWARSGNTVAFTATPVAGGTSYIYYIDIGTGTAAYTHSVAGGNPTWSPNNSSIAILGSGASFLKIAAFGTNVSTIATQSTTGALGPARWKR